MLVQEKKVVINQCIIFHIFFCLFIVLLSSISLEINAKNITVVSFNGKLIPNHANAFSNERIKLSIKNLGKSPIEFENLRLRVEKVLSSGSESFLILNKLKPGRYYFIDEFHPGAKFELVIK